MFSSLSVRKKIFGMDILTLFLGIALTAFFISQIKMIGDQLAVFTETTVPSVILVKNTENTLITLRRDQFLLLSNINNPNFDSWARGVESLIKKMDGNLAQYKEGLWDNRDKIAFEQLSKQWVGYRDASHQFISMLKSGQEQEANQFLLDSFGQFSKVIDATSDLEKLNQTYMTGDTAAAHQAIDNAILGALVALLIIAIMKSGLTWALVNQISKPLELVRNMALSIASGDLTYKLNRKKIGNDELGQLADSCLEMQQKLQSLVGNISSTSTQIGAAIEEVSAISTQTSQGMEEQQSQITLIATAMNEMQATVNEVASNTEEASTAATVAQKEAVSGLDVVELSIEKIRDIQTIVADTGTLATELKQDSENINGIVDVIQEITEQTNLLALNAAIEAARAGEFGRGFAVVADEVRTLASRTQTSTQDIVNIIQALQSKTEKAVSVTSESRKMMALCMEQAEKAGSDIRDIESGIENIAEMNIQIASACSEQSSVTEELGRNVENINQSSSEVAEGAKQTAQACHSLSELAVGLQDVVAKFRIA